MRQIDSTMRVTLCKHDRVLTLHVRAPHGFQRSNRLKYSFANRIQHEVSGTSHAHHSALGSDSMKRTHYLTLTRVLSRCNQLLSIN